MGRVQVMFDAGQENDKPFSDVRRARHDEGNRGKRLGQHGHTARKADTDRLAQNELERRSDNAIFHAHTYLDSGKEYSSERTCTLATPYKVTAFEADGLDVTYSLSRDSAWEAVPEVLAEHSVDMPSVQKLRDGRVMTSYHLKPTGMFLPDARVVAAQRQLATHIYMLPHKHRHHLKLDVVLPTEPPEDVAKPLLKVSLSCMRGRRPPQTAVVRCNQTTSFWDCERSHGRPLEVDLGCSCVISAFSTQGRQPATRTYPFTGKNDAGDWIVEDAASVAPEAPNAEYRGPWWRVRTAPGSRHFSTGGQGRCPARDDPYHQPAWVSRYELFWRADGARNWHSLGQFVGNTDETTEIAHSFANVRGGLRARYLRVLPLECEGGGAMRIGVYGATLHTNPTLVGTSDTSTRLFRFQGGTQCTATDELDEGLIRYTLTTATPSQHYVRDVNSSGCSYSSYRCRCSYCCDPRMRGSGARLRRRLAVSRDALETTSHSPSSVHASLTEEMCTSAELLEYYQGGYDDDVCADDVGTTDDSDEESPAGSSRAAKGGAHGLFTRGDEAALSLVEQEEMQLALALSASLAEVAVESQRYEQAREQGEECSSVGCEWAAGAGDVERISERMSEVSEEWCSQCSSTADDEWHMVEGE